MGVDVRGMCLALPGTAERSSHGAPAFVHRGRIFCWVMDDHHDSGRVEVWIKAEPPVQQERVQADPAHFFRPPYVGPKGWVGVLLGPTGRPPRLPTRVRDELVELLVDGYLSLVTRRAAAELDPVDLLDRVRAACDPPPSRSGKAVEQAAPSA